ncbi:unnamed protein product [Rotaria magnacalcarata]
MREQVENLTRGLQSKRGRLSINAKYDLLKRKRNQLERHLGNLLSQCATVNTNRNITDTQNVNSLRSSIVEVLANIVECNLENGSAEEIEHYINELEKLAGHDYGDKLQEYKLRKLAGHDYGDKLQEYKLRKFQVKQLNKIVDFETSLLSPQDDDVQSFLIKKPESTSYYETEKNINRWEVWFWILDGKEKNFTLETFEYSILSQFLNHTYHSKIVTSFVSELLDLMEEKNVFSAVVSDIELKTHLFTDNQLNLKSRRSKMTHICEALSEAYRLIGYYPLEQRCRRAISYFREEKQRFLMKISSAYKINIRSMINHDNESSHEYFIQPIEKNNYERQRLLKRGILIFDLRKVNDGNLLKQEIKSDVKRNFACVVRLTNQHYITLFIENKQPDKFNCDIRYIYVLISTDSEIDFSMLTRFTGVMDKCVYKLSIVECPQQRSMSEDRLLHSYLNATASQWAADSECWKALKDNFYRQKFSGRENIEKLKKWFIKDI